MRANVLSQFEIIRRFAVIGRPMRHTIEIGIAGLDELGPITTHSPRINYLSQQVQSPPWGWAREYSPRKTTFQVVPLSVDFSQVCSTLFGFILVTFTRFNTFYPFGSAARAFKFGG